MKIFVLARGPKDVRDAAGWGAVSGALFLPDLHTRLAGPEEVAAMLGDCRSLLEGRPLVVPLHAHGADAMTAEGEAYAAAAQDDLVVELPADASGMEAATRLLRQGIRVMIGLCADAAQAVVAAAAGVQMVAVSPRMIARASGDAMARVRQTRRALGAADPRPLLVVPGIADPRELVEAALAGVDISACSASVIRRALDHSDTRAELRERRRKGWGKAASVEEAFDMEAEEFSPPY